MKSCGPKKFKLHAGVKKCHFGNFSDWAVYCYCSPQKSLTGIQKIFFHTSERYISRSLILALLINQLRFAALELNKCTFSIDLLGANPPGFLIRVHVTIWIILCFAFLKNSAPICFFINCDWNSWKKQDFAEFYEDCFANKEGTWMNAHILAIRYTSKGQIISECPYEIIVSPIRPTKKFPRFLP